MGSDPTRACSSLAGRHLVILLLAGMLLGSCVIESHYPGAWPGIDPMRVAGCPDVAGTYLRDGVKGDPFAAESSLGELLLGDASSTGGVIEIAQYASDSLVVSAWKDEQPIGRRVFSRANGDYRCAPAGVELICGWHAFARKALEAGVARRKLYLGKATDGSLMVQEVDFTIEIMLIVPIVGTVRSWHRFSPPTFPPLPRSQPPVVIPPE